jgi:hypothetical protein
MAAEQRSSPGRATRGTLRTEALQFADSVVVRSPRELRARQSSSQIEFADAIASPVDHAAARREARMAALAFAPRVHTKDDNKQRNGASHLHFAGAPGAFWGEASATDNVGRPVTAMSRRGGLAAAGPVVGADFQPRVRLAADIAADQQASHFALAGPEPPTAGGRPNLALAYSRGATEARHYEPSSRPMSSRAAPRGVQRAQESHFALADMQSSSSDTLSPAAARRAVLRATAVPEAWAPPSSPGRHQLRSRMQTSHFALG